MRYCQYVIHLAHSWMLPAAVVSIGFALLARLIGAVTDGGAVAGVVAAFCLVSAGGLPAFLPLLTLFVLTLFATRWGYRRKESLGLAERERGRTAGQIGANLGAATLCTAAAVVFPQSNQLLMAGAMAALAEAAADTVSSEMGEAVTRNAYLISDFRSVPIGTNGAISFGGTLSGCIAACMVAVVSRFAGVVEWHWAPVIALAGIGGMLLDSILGATLENGGKMGNNAVNFVSTVFAADVALLVAAITSRMQRV